VGNAAFKVSVVACMPFGEIVERLNRMLEDRDAALARAKKAEAELDGLAISYLALLEQLRATIKDQCDCATSPYAKCNACSVADGLQMPKSVAEIIMKHDEALLDELVVVRSRMAIAAHALTATHGLMAYDDGIIEGAKEHFRIDNTAALKVIGIVEIYGPCERCGRKTDSEGECSSCRDFGGTDKVVRVVDVIAGVAIDPSEPDEDFGHDSTLPSAEQMDGYRRLK